MSKRNIKMATKEEKISICCREYFISDETILIDSSMLRVRKLRFLLENNSYFGNKILFSKCDVVRYRKYTPEKNGELVATNAKAILELLKKYPEYYETVEIPDGYEEKVDFLKRNKKVILYTIDNEIKTNLENCGLRCRAYKKNAMIDEKFPNSVKFCVLPEIDYENNSIYIVPSKDIKVYSYKLIELNFNRVKLDTGSYILKIKRKEKFTRYIIYKVVNYHSRKNLIQIAWTEIRKYSDQTEINYIPEYLKEIIRQNM